MEIGTRVWLRDDETEEAWVAGHVIGKEEDDAHGVILTVADEFHNNHRLFRMKSEHEDCHEVKLRNADIEGHVSNLIKLPFLNEPAILHCLSERYIDGKIYTYTGPILIAVNPFKRLDLYSKRLLDEYYNNGLMRSHGIDTGTDLVPHVFAIADNAYRQMMIAIMSSHTSERQKSTASVSPGNQSILISGESGAGKTESTKVVLTYLTTVGTSPDSSTTSFGDSVMEKVLQSNPILESFGNAKTKRNDNSSRFGKFIELNFNKRGHLIGGRICTYLLEKVRLPLQQAGERNFHVFYQLVSGSSAEDRQRRQLERLEDFNYTSKSGVFLLTTINDTEQYHELCHGLQALNFDTEDITRIFDIVAGILHLGQLFFESFVDGEGEGSTLSSLSAVQTAAVATTNLLGISLEVLLEVFTKRQIIAAGEVYTKKLTKVQAADARDAVAKTVYGRLFEWLVYVINSRIRVDPTLIRASIGVLDIFGFESFAVNSFEQLCINYANETLQQQFNQFVFKLEQTEYEREQIEWSFVQFPDNKDCLELIEHKIHGVFAMLDDECKLPKASDEKFAARMYKELASHGRFSATAAQKRSSKFSINHYAGSVEYTTTTFVEKNKDELPKEATAVLQMSTNHLVRLLFSQNFEDDDEVDIFDERKAVSSPPAMLLRRKSLNSRTTSTNMISSAYSVATQFKEQLNNLMATIHATSPHYIRCLKPNDKNIPDNFHRVRITEQLRYGGVLEAVRVARSGFPVRLMHAEFCQRYQMIVHARHVRGPPDYKAFCVNFVTALKEIVMHSERNSKLERYTFDFTGDISWDGFQVGLSKLFLRKESHDFLETCRYRCMSHAAVQIQSMYRACFYRLRYQNILMAVKLLQRVYRGYLARAKVNFLRRTKAVITIQTVFRTFRNVARYLSFRFATICLQSNWRRRKEGAAFRELRRMRAATLIVTMTRRYLYTRRFSRFRVAVVKLQGRYRCKIAKVIFRKLKVEARDLGRLQENNESLKREIESLKLRATEERQRIKQETLRQAESDLLIVKEQEMQTLRSQLLELRILFESERRAREALEKTAAVSQMNENYNNNFKVCKKCKERLGVDDEGNVVPHGPQTPQTSDKTDVSLFQSPTKRPFRRNTLDTAKMDAQQEASFFSSAKSPVPRKSEGARENEAIQAEITKLRKEGVEQRTTIETLKRELARLKVALDEKPGEEPSRRRSGDYSAAARLRRRSVKSPKTLEKDATENGHQPTGDAQWSVAWDGEDDSSESGVSIASAAHVPSSSSSSSSQAAFPPVVSNVFSPSASQSAALQSIERNLEKWRTELIKGIRAVMWEGQRILATEITMKLDSIGSILQFLPNQQKRAFTFFNTKVEIVPLKLTDILECVPGAEINVDSSEKNLMLTIIAKEASGSRVLVLKLSNRDERNVLISKLRAISAASTVLSDKQSPESKPVHATRPAINTSTMPESYTTSTSEANPLFAQRLTRRPSVREVVITRNLNTASSSAFNSEKFEIENRGMRSKTNVESDGLSTLNPLSVKSLMTQLKEEKEATMKAKIQLMTMNGELVERDEQLAALKKSQADYETQLHEKENLMKQDNMVRLQLGKRLEQVLMDKEDALEQLEQLKAQLDIITRGL